LPWQINAGAGLYKLDYLRPDPAQGGEIVASKSDSYQIQINSTNRLFYNEKAWIESEQFVHYTGVSTNNYRDFKERWETGISFRSVLIPFENLRLFPRIRLDFISSYGAVISPAFGFNYSILSDLNLFGETSYNFNPPTFNSLYWPGMGDEDLDAERSLKSELGFRGEQELAKQFQVNLSLTGYLAFVNDGIMWIPDAETGLYRPQNVIESTHKGGESDVALNMTVGKTTLSAFSAIGYTRAEMTKSRFENDRALNKQFRYVPEWTFKHGITAKYKNVTLSLYHQQVSERYTKEDNSASLPSYSSFEGEISFTYTLFDTQFQHRLEIDNLTDESYQIIAGYPVPGRSFLFTTTLTFK
jgi:outer membrane cobalamin receptor